MDSFIRKILIRQKGSLTVEASLVLPIFICAILTIGFLTKIVYTHEIVQYAITEAANEMASSSYLYYVSGIYDIDDTLNDELEERKQRSEEHINNIVDSFKELNTSLDQIKAKTYGSYEYIVSNSKDEMINLASLVAKAEIDKDKTYIGNILIRHYIKKHGLTDNRLRNLDIDKLDFSQSSYFKNNQDIDVVVKYKVNIPVPIKFISYMPIVQRATARAWLGGNDGLLALGTDAKYKEAKGKVYVSKRGSSYHRFGCYHIFKEIEALDLEEAKKLGLKPCKKCDPPLESSGECRVFKSKKSNDGKYHREGCTHLFKDIMEINLDEAWKKYKPCKTCNPPKPNE